jgi:hypothetical protein
VEDHKENPAGTTDPREGRHLARNYFFLLLGIAGLLLVYWYSGPLFDLVHSYGGNLSASFAFYFIVRPTVARVRSNRAASVFIALLVAELFEATNGFFGVMTNVYDPLDYLVNALGVALAVAVDVFAAYVSRSRDRRIRVVDRDAPHQANAG